MDIKKSVKIYDNDVHSYVKFMHMPNMVISASYMAIKGHTKVGICNFRFLSSLE